MLELQSRKERERERVCSPRVQARCENHPAEVGMFQILNTGSP